MKTKVIKNLILVIDNRDENIIREIVYDTF